jgi:hypothetical protein
MTLSKVFRERLRETKPLVSVRPQLAQTVFGSSSAALAPVPPVPNKPTQRKKRGYRKKKVLSEPVPSLTPSWPWGEYSLPSHAHSRPLA